MSITSLRIRNFRNIEACELAPRAGINLLVGPNGAGKTALLEAVYLLARGKSFRSAGSRPLVMEGADRFEVFGRVGSDPARLHRIGIQAGRGERRIRVDGREEGRASTLARLLPVGVLVPQSHALLDRGPEGRRRLLDWGVFHVEHTYRDEVQRYGRALRQRNLSLKADPRVAAAWEPALAAAGERITLRRQLYVEELNRRLPGWSARLLGREVRVAFRRGWREGAESLEHALRAGREGDTERGFTRVGPHRADLQILIGGREASLFGSRGQQKMTIAAMLLAQAELLEERRPGELVLLVDDFPAELDRDWRWMLWEAIEGLGAQTLMTATETALFPGKSEALFHVEHGRVTGASEQQGPPVPGAQRV
jgi:DNA replication and repair protein RecF